VNVVIALGGKAFQIVIFLLDGNRIESIFLQQVFKKCFVAIIIVYHVPLAL